MDEAVGGISIGKGSRSTRRKPAPALLCPPQIPHDQTRARTRAAAVGSRRLTAWAMAQLGYVMGTGASLRGSETAVACSCQPPLYRAEVKNTFIYTSTPHTFSWRESADLTWLSFLAMQTYRKKLGAVLFTGCVICVSLMGFLDNTSIAQTEIKTRVLYLVGIVLSTACFRWRQPVSNGWSIHGCHYCSTTDRCLWSAATFTILSMQSLVKEYKLKLKIEVEICV
jgi:hypothetical protein